MAGIGFDLRNLVRADQTLGARCRAYAAAGLIAAGPWLVTMASLWFVRAFATWLPSAELDGFLSIVSHVFAASLISVGGLQMAVTRWLADALFERRYDPLVPAFATCTAAVAAVQAVTGWLGCRWLGLDAAVTAATVPLYVAVSLSWLAMVWLTVIRQHDKVVLAFALGGVAFVAGLLLLGRGADLVALLTLFALANGLVVVLMSVLVVRGTERAGPRSLQVLHGIWRYRLLLLTGTAYGLSLWIDKWVFWSCDGVTSVGALRHHPLYDSCFYLSYLTVVPALTVNLVHLETDFYERYRSYFAAVTGHCSLPEIRRRGADMNDSLLRSANHLLRVQGAVTVACMLLATPIVRTLGMPDFAARVLRCACIGSFCQVLLLLTILVLLYFDRRRAVLSTALVFLAANAGLAWWSVHAGPQTYGVGYALAALAALLFALVELRRTFAVLEYSVFTRT